MLVVVNRELWPLRFLFVFAVFSALINPDFAIPESIERGGWPVLTAYLGLFYLFVLPLLAAEWALGHWLKGIVGTFLTFPIFGAFAVGLIVLNLILAPIQAATTGVSAFYLYHTFSSAMYKGKIIGCTQNDPRCCVQPDLLSTAEKFSSNQHAGLQCVGGFSNSSERFYENIVRLESKANKEEDLQIKNPISWHYWLACLAVFGLAFLIVSAGPITLGFFSFIYLLGIFALVVAMSVLLDFRHLEPSQRWSEFSRQMEKSDWNDLKTRETWDSTLLTIFRFSSIGLGIMPTLANFNHPSSPRWYISDVLFIMIVYPAFLIATCFLHFNMKNHFTDFPESYNFKFGVIPIVLSKLSNPQLWTALYLVGDILRGVLLLACNLEVINSCIMHLIELCHVIRRPVVYRPVVSFLTAIVLAFAGIVYCADGGYRLLQFVGDYVHRFVPVLLVVELFILVSVLVHDLCQGKRGPQPCGRILGRALSVPFLLLLTAVTVYIAYLLNRDTFDEINVVGWVVALLPLAVAVAITPFLLVGACCYGCIQTDESACSVACGPHFARNNENPFDYDDDEEFAMLEKYA